MPAHSASQENTPRVSSGASAPSAEVNGDSHAVPPFAATESESVGSKANSVNGASEVPSAAVPALTQGKVQAAAITERIPKSNSSIDVSSAATKLHEAVEPEVKRPSLGAVRLAKPKVGRGANVQPNSEMEPALELGNDTLSADNSLGSGFAASSKQPAAPAVPVPVGGDVTPARLISSVPPNYPAMAKTQHVAGDVRVDALIDANGRVTTMKVVSGPSLLHQSAMDALRQWKYSAATLDGKPVPMHLTVTIQFRLQ
jgi:TonB family protein